MEMAFYILYISLLRVSNCESHAEGMLVRVKNGEEWMHKNIVVDHIQHFRSHLHFISFLYISNSAIAILDFWFVPLLSLTCSPLPIGPFPRFPISFRHFVSCPYLVTLSPGRIVNRPLFVCVCVVSIANKPRNVLGGTNPERTENLNAINVVGPMVWRDEVQQCNCTFTCKSKTWNLLICRS